MTENYLLGNERLSVYPLKEGSEAFVTATSGAVGSIVRQIVNLMGCRLKPCEDLIRRLLSYFLRNPR